MVIKDRSVTITAVNTTTPLISLSFNQPYDIKKSITISQVFNAIAATPGFTVDNLSQSLGPLGAIALIEGEYILDPSVMNNVKAFTSLLWAIYRPLAYVLEQAKDDIDTAIQQIGFVTAQGDFLDYWGGIFGIPRYSTFASTVVTSITAPVTAGLAAKIKVGNVGGLQVGNYVLINSGNNNFERVPIISIVDTQTFVANLLNNHVVGESVAIENSLHTVEPDYEYSVRLLWETIKPRVNNKAIEELLFRGTGYSTTVTDLSSKILLSDGYPTPVDKTSPISHTDANMVSDGFLTSTSQGFPEDTVRYGIGERFNYGSFGVFVEVPINHAFYQYTTQQIEDIVERHRAAGTTPWFTINQIAKETFAAISEVVTQLQADIQQDIDEGRAMLFGYDDFQFYGDHWSQDNLTKMPWYQNNLDKPSLSDNVVMQSNKLTTPAQFSSNNSAVFISGPLADGFLGGYNRNLLFSDTTSNSDDFVFRIIPAQFQTAAETTTFVNQPVQLNYKRFSDEFITPRVLEGFTSDVLTFSAGSIVGPLSITDITGASVSDGVTATCSFTNTSGTNPFAIGQRIVVAGVSNQAFNQTYSVSANNSSTQSNIALLPSEATKSDTASFRIQTTGGTNNVKFFLDVGLLASGAAGFLGMTVKNQGIAPLIVSNQYVNGPTLQPGQQCIISLNATGTGVLDLQIRFQTLSSSDNIDCIASPPVLTVNGVSVLPSGASTYSIPPFTKFSGAQVTVTPGFPTPNPLPFVDAGAGGTIASDTSALSSVPLTGVAPSTTITSTTPLIITAPTSITGVKFNAIALSQANINSVPAVIRNLEIPNFGENWNTNFSASRLWIVPLQDSDGNVYYMNIMWPYNTTPSVPSLRIFNPTSSISSDHVEIQAGDIINITWAATNSNGTVTLRRETIATGAITDLPVAATGTAQFAAGAAVTQNTRFHLIVNGNNGQIAESIVTITVVAARTNAQPPTITLTATPDVVELCSTNRTIIAYSVTFNSIQTETQVVAFPSNVTQVVLTPLAGDPVGTTILAPKETTPGVFQPRQITVVRANDGITVPGAWSNLETGAATFIPVDPTLAQGHSLSFNYDVNYGGSFLKFQNSNITLPNNGNVYQISQSVAIDIVPPAVSPAPTQYVVNYSVTADNYATAPVTQTIPVYVQTVQQGAGPFVVNTIAPTQITEAIGPTVNQSVTITLTGTGFSSKMAVFLEQRVISPTDPTTFIPQLVKADITSVDWVNGTLTFIAPKLTYNTSGYPVVVRKLNCLGETLETNRSQVLVYLRSSYRDAPVIESITPSTVCLVPGFVSKQISITGKFFRPGAQAYVVKSTGPVALPTTVVNLNQLLATVNFAVAGSYDLIIENTDTSSGATKGQPLVLMANNTIPTINVFGYTPPVSTGGCVYYSTPFTLNWNCTNASSVSFLSSDPLVQTALQPPDSTNWPASGSASVGVNIKGTTITMIATNDCNNTASSAITINDPACDRTLGIKVVPNPVYIKDQLAYKLHTHRLSFNDITNVATEIDITDDPNLKYALVDANDNLLNLVVFGANSQAISLVDRYITAVKNGYARVRAYWNGFINVSPVYVTLPVPIGITATPTPILFTNIGQLFQLTLTATYSDGTTRVVTSHQNTRYYDYSINICSVTATGAVTTQGLGSTFIHCSYFDAFDPTAVVYTTVQVGNPDNCVEFERLFVNPPYEIAGTPTPSPISVAINGVNNQNLTAMTDPSGNFSFTYQGMLAGQDQIQVSSQVPALTSNAVNVLWITPTAPVMCSQVTGFFYTCDGSGIFNTNGQNPVFSQTFNSLNFNDAVLGQSQAAHPILNAVLDSNGNKTADIQITDGTNVLGVGTLFNFNAVLTGSFVIKNAGMVAFTITSDDGFVFGVDGGASRISGPYIGAPTTGTTVYSKLPIMGANNVPTAPNSVIINVSFPGPGIYPFEIDWAEGLGASATLSVLANGSVIVPITLATPVSNVIPTPSVGILTLQQAKAGPFVTGSQLTITGTSIGVFGQAGQFTLNIIGDNVRAAMVNGTSVLSSGALQPLWSYANTEIITASKTYQVTIGNNSSSITAKAIANLITIPPVAINKFTAYDATNSASPEVTGALTVEYGAAIGLCWNVSNAVEVFISHAFNNVAVLQDLAGAGSMYDVPVTDRSYTITAIGTDGSAVSQTIAVTVNNYKHFTHDWAFGPWYAPGNYWRLWPGFVSGQSNPSMIHAGQTSTITLPAWDINYAENFWDFYLTPFGGSPAFPAGTYDDRTWSRYTNLSSISDVTVSTDGTRPASGVPVVQYNQRTAQSDSLTVAPSVNTIYQFNLSGWWFWWFWLDWAFDRSPTISFLNGRFNVPYRGAISHTWNYGLCGVVNVDQGPRLQSITASAAVVNAGEPVTISYTVSGASKVKAVFAQNESFPNYTATFTVFPDKTTDFAFTAISPTGLTLNFSIHVAVIPQVLFAPCLGLPMPQVSSIALDGVSSTLGVLSINEEETVHVLEIFGNHFIGDRVATPEVLGTVKTVFTHQSGTAATGFDLLELSAVSNTYVRAKVAVHPVTLAGNYTVAIMNDNGISNEKGPLQSFTVATTIPKFVMNKAVSAYSGGIITLFLDDYDPVRDAGLVILVGTKAVSPISIGSNLSDTDFTTQMYLQVLGRSPSATELAGRLAQLGNGTITRYDLMNALLTSAEYKNSGRNASVGVGTRLTVAVNSVSAIGLGLQTNNGISATQVEFIPVAIPPAPPVVTNSCCVITGVSPMSGYPGDVIDVTGNNFTVTTKITLGSGVQKAVTTAFISSTHLQFSVPSYTTSTVVSVVVQDGTCSDSYAGFLANQFDTTPVDQGIAPTIGVGGARFPGAALTSVSSIGTTNPVTLSATSVPPTTTQTPTGTVLTQPTVIATAVTATVTTTSVNNQPVASASSAQITTVNYSDLSAARLELA